MTIEKLVAQLQAGGRPAPGDDVVTQLEHGLQCAAVLEHAHPDDVELQVAGLVHDIGHTVAPGDDAGHGRVGGDYVRALLGDRVAALVELHVPAKRWLVTVDPEYRSRLSAGSIRSLAAQGEIMDAAARAAFEAEPHHRAAVMLRRADEAAKVAGLDVGGLDRWVPLLQRLQRLAHDGA